VVAQDGLEGPAAFAAVFAARGGVDVLLRGQAPARRDGVDPRRRRQPHDDGPLPARLRRRPRRWRVAARRRRARRVTALMPAARALVAAEFERGGGAVVRAGVCVDGTRTGMVARGVAPDLRN
jgi:hypothetical protein